MKSMTDTTENYQAVQNQVTHIMEVIKKRIIKHAVKQSQDKSNWLYTEQLGDVRSDLEKLLNKLAI